MPPTKLATQPFASETYHFMGHHYHTSLWEDGDLVITCIMLTDPTDQSICRWNFADLGGKDQGFYFANARQMINTNERYMRVMEQVSIIQPAAAASLPH